MKQTSKEKVLEKALQIMSRSPQASMEQVAVQSGVSRATLYRHFSTKDLMLKEMIFESGRIFESVINPIMEEQSGAKDKLTKFIHNIIPSGAKFYFLFYNDMFLQDEAIKSIYDTQSDLLKKLCILLKNDGVIDPLVPDEWAASSLEFMLYAAWERIHKGDIALNKAPGLILQTYLNGLEAGGKK